MKKALFFTPNNGSVECFLCRHHCKIDDQGLGLCKVRKNIKGELFSLNYGKLVAKNVDPIEKKPFYHFLPGSLAYSVASLGCNFSCSFCQNWEISQAQEFDRLGGRFYEAKPEDIVKEAKDAGCRSISYTYTEPTVFFEFALKTSKIAKDNSLFNNFVTNGYMSREALLEISGFLDACNVDLKAYSDKFYRQFCGAILEKVLDSIRYMKELGIWIEITTLLIPGLNDSEEELTGLCNFIAGLDRNIPWHISRFYPHYKLEHIKPTPQDTLQRAYEIGKDSGLSHIYIGNIHTQNGQNTYCNHCKKLIVKRDGFYVSLNRIKLGKCDFCGNEIAGVF